MRPERILVLRSGRHLQVALRSLRERFPACHIGVVGTPGSRPAIEQAGIAPEDAFTCDAPRFRPLSFLFSRTTVAARQWRYDGVAILWNDPEGTGQGNVDRTACLLSPRGYLAITPDGSIVEREVLPQVRTELLRLVASIGTAAALAVLLYVPAVALRTVTTMTRRVRRQGSQGQRGTDGRVSPIQGPGHLPTGAGAARDI